MTAARDERYRAVIAMLKSARLNADFSQAKLAQLIGQRQQFVSKYENGERRLDVVEFVDIARELGIDWKDVLRDL